MDRTRFRLTFYFAALVALSAAVPPRGTAQTAPTLSVDAASSAHPINPDIYGLASYGLDAGFAKEIQVPNIRWGGDGTTRYNWQVDSSNAGFDWYFMGGNGQATPKPSASADLMINTYAAASKAHTLLTIPIIPWVNKSAAWNCSFPVSVYGAQQSTNPYVHPNGDNCGNSIATGGAQLTDNNVYANHIDNSVALQQGWLQHLISTFGTAADGGVPYYQLDNEPGGWSNTHRDVEPSQPTYDTIISLGQQYAAMIKQTDPSAKVLGPVDFTLGGWIGTPSKQNNLYAGEYYLQKMAAYDLANHQRILDYFDEHYYGGGSTDAAELASTRALWDPTFNSGSWVEQYYFGGPMMLLPRFQTWIQTYYPGTKLSISEYSFASGTNPLVDALTEADVLGIYGREGLDFANMWNVPKPTDALAYSFRLYRNYDGAGGQFGDVSVGSTSTNQGELSVYGAVRSSDGALTVVAINKTTSAIASSVALANFKSAESAAVYTYSNANLTQIIAGPPAPVVSDVVAYNFPAYSATVLVFTPAGSSVTATTTSLAASSGQITSGQSVAFTATVAHTGGTGVPTGTVTFNSGATQLGSAILGASGTATLSLSSLAAGSYTVTASYPGDSNFSASTSSTVQVTVTSPGKTSTTASLSASATQVTSGQNVTLTVNVKPSAGASTPTGSVTFLDGQTSIGTAPLSGGAGSLSTSALSTGTHTITAAYSGDANFSACTSSALMVQVSVPTKPAKIATSISLSAAATQLPSGQNDTFTAGVAPQSGAGVPSGSVTFFNGQTQIGMSALNGGTAAFSIANLPAGAQAITAAYSGDASYAASTSGALTINVGAAPTADYSLSMNVSSLTLTPGSSGNLTITLTPGNGFKQVVGLACSGLPTGGTCSFSPQNLNPAGGSVATTLTVRAPATTASAFLNLRFSGPLTGAILCLFAMAFAGIAGVANKGSILAVRLAPALLSLAMFTALMGTAGCAEIAPAGSASPVTSYVVTVTATAANAPTHTQQFTLTVKP